MRGLLTSRMLVLTLVLLLGCAGGSTVDPGPTPQVIEKVDTLTPIPTPTASPSVTLIDPESGCPPTDSKYGGCYGCCGDFHTEVVNPDGTSSSYMGPRLAHVVRDTDAVIVGTLVSVKPVGIEMDKGSYETGFMFTFEVSEYLKGSSEPQVQVVANYCIGGFSYHPLPTHDEAATWTCPLLVGRNKELDGLERVVFLHDTDRYDTDAYYGGYLSTVERRRSFGVERNYGYLVGVQYNNYIVLNGAIHYSVENRSVTLDEIRALVRDGVPQTLPPVVRPNCDGAWFHLQDSVARRVKDELEARGLELDFAQALDSLNADPSGEWVYVIESYGSQEWSATALMTTQENEFGCVVTDIKVTHEMKGP